MVKVFGKKGFLIFLGGFILLASNAFGQDLGSSNGIFRPTNPTTKKSSTETSKTSKSKNTSIAAKKSAPKTVAKSTPKPKPARPRQTVSRNPVKRTPAVIPQPQNNVIITVGNQNNSINTTAFDEQFEQAVEEGNTARDERNYVRAESAYHRAFNLKPKDSRAVYGLGNIFADQQRWEEAEKSYRQAVALDTNAVGAYVALSYVLTQPVVGGNLSERFAEAERMARRAIQIDPANAFAYDQLGVSLESRGMISPETQKIYRKAIEIEPEFALAYAHLGRLLRRTGKTDESSEAYAKAIKFSTDVPTMILVADVMQSQQKYLESEQLLRSALAIDPKNPTALFMLGRALTARNQFDEAEKVLKKSIEVSPGSFVSYMLLGSLNLRRARLDDAEKALNKALKVVSQNERKRLAQEFEAIGDAYAKSSKEKDAQRLYQQAIALDGSKTILNEKLAKVR